MPSDSVNRIVGKFCELRKNSTEAAPLTAGEKGIVPLARAEAGNLQYDYFLPVGNDDDLFLVEKQQMDKAFEQGDTAAVNRHANLLLDLMIDLDQLNGQHRQSTLHTWLQQPSVRIQVSSYQFCLVS